MKIVKTLLFLPLIALIGCSESSTSGNNNQDVGGGNQNSEASNNSMLVVYFSASGNTERVANVISEHLDTPLYELIPVDPYTSVDLNYNNSESRVSQEHNDPNCRVELETITFDEFEESTYIFLGAPVWWGEMSWVINDFVSENDFTGKTIIPFVTSASSSVRTSDLELLAPEATWLSGQRFSSRVSDEDVISWVDGLNLDL